MVALDLVPEYLRGKLASKMAGGKMLGEQDSGTKIDLVFLFHPISRENFVVVCVCVCAEER